MPPPAPLAQLAQQVAGGKKGLSGGNGSGSGALGTTPPSGAGAAAGPPRLRAQTLLAGAAALKRPSLPTEQAQGQGQGQQGGAPGGGLGDLLRNGLSDRFARLATAQRLDESLVPGGGGGGIDSTFG